MESVKKYYVEFVHPKYGEQNTDRKTKKDILQYLSYMVFAHEITSIKLYENGKLLNNYKIPKW